ncbi:hypothetical protein H0I23_03185 [Cellulophaga sp. HaHaR_3_176]|uniref:tetratricopeptide repeat protein n=1 Tax=Cellulophaga sp. HaHaR_3_176 TaxID=1942464 RepID=UPI001C1F9A61|nr:hypothetical protein [Cellulophaga sp. HaHaR_3_176]QWX84665.1 hypothetical protein H0I23_03185 [Cellulophaga sp. HaHaR_3_176]
MEELDDELLLKIQKLSEQGDALAEDGKFSEALSFYWDAYDTIPKPKTEWEATTWLLAAIGDANFLSADFEAGMQNLSNAMHCPNAIGNPFLHLRLGQCQFELGNLDRAANELTRAYALEGEELFADDDTKYFEFLKTKIKLEKPKKKPWWKF